MSIGGISIILVLGLVNLALIAFQLATGLHYLRVKPIVHRYTGLILLFCSLIHGLLAYFAS
jgi:hypothetical protein